MIKVFFVYKGVETEMQCNQNDVMENIFKKFANKVETNISTLYFLYNGKIIEKNMKLISLMNDDSKRNQTIKIIAIDGAEEQNKTIKRSEDVICPKCYRQGRLLFDHLNLILYCPIGHTTGNLTIEQFENIQKINESSIKCDICKQKNKSETYNNEFFICLKCKKNICPLCRNSHKDHKDYVHDYRERLYFCDNHNEKYHMYCNTCEKNVCIECENNHKNHELISYGSIVFNNQDLLNQKNKIKLYGQMKFSLFLINSTIYYWYFNLKYA